MSCRVRIGPRITRESAPLARSIIPAASNSRESAGIWVGAFRNYCRPLGYGSAPSDPRRTYYIGNRGNRKPEKIRKIEKACFSQPISSDSDSWHNVQRTGNRQGRNKQTILPWRELVDGQGAAFEAGSPLRTSFRVLRHLCNASARNKVSVDYFDPRRVGTLETFSDRSEESETSDCVDSADFED